MNNRLKNTFTATIRKSKVDMNAACLNLSSRAYHLLSMIHYGHIKGEDLKDTRANLALGISKKTYDNVKYELKKKGYIKIHRLRSNHFIWFVGKESIKKSEKRYENKTDSEYKDQAKEFYDTFL